MTVTLARPAPAWSALAGPRPLADSGRRPTGGAPSGDDVQALVQTAIEALSALAEAGRQSTSWSAELQAAVLAGWDRLSGQVVAGRAVVLDAHLDSGAWTSRGDRDEAAWRARTGHEGLAAGIAQVRTARALSALPAVASALAEGAITPTHVDQLARIRAAAGPVVVQQLGTPDGQDEVLQLAARTDARTFGRSLARWAAQREPATVQSRHDAQRAARFLTLADTPDGTAVRGLLDTSTGRRLRLALESVTPAPAVDDERSAEQRRADALGTLAERVLSATDEDLPGGLGRTQVSVVLSERTWVSVRGTSGSTVGLVEALVGVPPAVDDDGSPVPASELSRLLCDCDLTRIVLTAESVVTDLGRTTRLHTPRLRRAIAARDGGCAWAGCTLPARYCQVHHPHWWSRGGGTSVDNGVLLCSFHHHEVHRRDLAVTRHPAPPDRAGPAGSPVAAYTITEASGRVLADSRGPVAGAHPPEPGEPPGS
ncbi:MAG: HNH endonuclease [Cellulomonas sp.]|nr:HNH endonuclease [Cellulomonas sp.]